jgi:hypothetical protein
MSIHQNRLHRSLVFKMSGFLFGRFLESLPKTNHLPLRWTLSTEHYHEELCLTTATSKQPFLLYGNRFIRTGQEELTFRWDGENITQQGGLHREKEGQWVGIGQFQLLSLNLSNARSVNFREHAK